MNFRIFLMEHLSVIVQKIRFLKLQIQGYRNVHPEAVMESHLFLDKVCPSGIHIGKGALVAAHTTILCHEHVMRDPADPHLPLVREVFVGERTFIGVGVTILPGVHIGNECIIGAASVVVKDIPDHSIAVGNPARVVRSDIKMNGKAILVEG